MSTLQNGALYVIVFLQNWKLLPGQYHWGLYYHMNEAVGGMKYHITNIPVGGGWTIGHSEIKAALKSANLIGLVKIADNTGSSTIYNKIDSLITVNDLSINEESTTCRVYVLAAIRRLIGEGIVKCNDLKALELEVKTFGDTFAHDTLNNKQPRPIISSRVCGY